MMGSIAKPMKLYYASFFLCNGLPRRFEAFSHSVKLPNKDFVLVSAVTTQNITLKTVTGDLLSQYWLEIETSFCFLPAAWGRQLSPKIIVRDNFRTKKTNLLLRWWRYTHTFNRFSRSGISTFCHWSQGLANETWNPKCESRHPPFLARNANENPASETSRPLATSSLAAKKGSRSRGRLVASLIN